MEAPIPEASSQTSVYPDEWHLRGHPAPAAASNSTKTTAAQTPRTPQTYRGNISRQKRCNPQSHTTSGRSSPATATSPQNGSSQYLLTFHLLYCSAMRDACQGVFVAWNESEQDERKRAPRDDEPNQ